MAEANYFSHPSAAARYAQFRPYFHPLVMERLVRFTGCPRFSRALDVACGVGLSTRALAAIADQVAAIDNSAAMLAQAPALPNVVYQAADAEKLPFPDSTFDLVAVGLAFHWFDQDQFLREAARVLSPGGWLFIYNNVFLGSMREDPAFKKWVGEVFLAKYLTPHRARKKLSSGYAGVFGFELAGTENLPNEVSWSREQMVGYFLSQSNVIASVEQGSEKLEEVAAWLDRGIAPFFTPSPRTMQFSSDIWYLRRRG